MTKKETSEVHDWAAYWFVALERAIEDGEYGRAAEAQEQLSRLGFSVKFKQQPQSHPLREDVKA